MTLARAVRAVRRFIRQRLCRLVHGHELYEARSSNRLFRACLRCGFETPGWTLDVAPRFRRQLSARPRWQPGCAESSSKRTGLRNRKYVIVR